MLLDLYAITKTSIPVTRIGVTCESLLFLSMLTMNISGVWQMQHLQNLSQHSNTVNIRNSRTQWFNVLYVCISNYRLKFSSRNTVKQEKEIREIQEAHSSSGNTND